MEMILILIIAGVLFWVVKITFFHKTTTEKPAKVNKRVPIANTFAEPVPDAPAKKIKWGVYDDTFDHEHDDSLDIETYSGTNTGTVVMGSD